jgi:threonine dehydratase
MDQKKERTKEQVKDVTLGVGVLIGGIALYTAALSPVILVFAGLPLLYFWDKK